MAELGQSTSFAVRGGASHAAQPAGRQEMPSGPSNEMSLRQFKKIVMVVFFSSSTLVHFGGKYIISMEFQSIFL